MAEDRNWSTNVTGTTPEFFEIRNWPARLGALLSPEDVDAGAKNVVLGQTVATNLFGASADPIGQTVRIANVPFQVVGVAAGKGQSASGNDYDDVVYVPVTTYLAKIQGSLQKFIPGSDPGRGHVRRRHRPRSATGSRRCCAIATASASAATTISRSRT